MSKRYKKIYIEILNYCNLNCPFCVKTKKAKKIITIDEFKHVIEEIKPYTDYIYLHVQGEPLMHPNLKELIEIAKDNNIYVNLTTNTTLLNKNIDLLINSSNIRQINLSLQALQYLNNKNEYYDNIIKLIKLNPNIYLSLRLWGNFNDDIVKEEIKYFEDQLNLKTNLEETNRLKEHVYFSLDEEFTWPSLDNPFNSSIGKCQAVNQLAILVDGTVVPCCLDKDGIIDLGNVYTTPLKDILESNRYQELIKGFKENKVTEDLCKHCTYLNRFKKD